MDDRASLAVAASFVRRGRVGGAEYMLYNLLEGLAAAAPPSTTMVVYEPGRDHLAYVPANATRARVRAPQSRFAQEAAIALTRSHDLVIHPNYFTPPGSRSRTLTIVHDLQYRHLPQYFSRRKRAWLWAAHRYTLRSADIVVAITHAVRDDMLAEYGNAAERVVVIPNPISWARLEDDAATDNPHMRPYFLVVAAHYPHKNLGTLLKAFRAFRRTGGTTDLVLVGALISDLVGTSATYVDSVDSEPGLIVTGHVPDAQVGSWYRHARCLILPSLFEGFGMPAVEALGLGTPVLATDIPALKEATLGLANYCDQPLSVDRWVTLMRAAERGDLATPNSHDVARLRREYDVARIGGLYLQCADC